MMDNGNVILVKKEDLLNAIGHLQIARKYFDEMIVYDGVNLKPALACKEIETAKGILKEYLDEKAE